jgi:hypothetical protein
MDLCGRCAKEVPDDAQLEYCWYCEGPLCVDCWERTGVCGCPGSDQAQRDLLSANTEEERRAIMTRPGLIGKTRPRRTQ